MTGVLCCRVIDVEVNFSLLIFWYIYGNLVCHRQSEPFALILFALTRASWKIVILATSFAIGLFLPLDEEHPISPTCCIQGFLLLAANSEVLLDRTYLQPKQLSSSMFTELERSSVP